MTKRNHCRVVITDECNLSCEFCCMNDLEIYKSFETVRALYIAEKRYDEVCITGGEPLLELPKVVQFAALVRYFNPDVKIYLYTNGILLTEETLETLKLSGITGINWLAHSFISEMEYMFLNDILPIRFLLGEKEMSKQNLEIMIGDIKNQKMDMRIWKMDDCKDMPEKNRYRIDWSRT